MAAHRLLGGRSGGIDQNIGRATDLLAWRKKSLDDIRAPDIEMAGKDLAAIACERLAYSRNLRRIGIGGCIGGTAGNLINVGAHGNIGAFTHQDMGNGEPLPGQPPVIMAERPLNVPIRPS